VRCADLVRVLARELHRPAVLPVPRAALRVVLGEFADDMLTSARLVPAVLQAGAFPYAHPTVDAAAAWVVGHRVRAAAAS
jgi:hypothetical protein